MVPLRVAALTCVLLAPLAFLCGPIAGQEPSHPALGLALDADLGWIEDGTPFLDGPIPKRALTEAERAVDRAALLDGAIERAAQEERLVLWHVPRFSEAQLAQMEAMVQAGLNYWRHQDASRGAGTHSPTLEDAYLVLVGNGAGGGDLQ